MNTEIAESVVQINELALDKECIRLPSDYVKYSQRAADLKRDVEEAKNELEVITADLSKKIRDEPNVYGLEKVTEAGISNVVLTRKEYKEALQKLSEAKHQSELCQAVVWALDAKKKSLEMLVSLHGMGYFSNVKMDRKGKEAVEEMTKRNVRRRWQDD